MDVSSEEFNFSQWLADCLSTNLNNDTNFDNFASNIFETIGQFARLNKNDHINYFSQLEKDIVNRLRTSLSYEVLDHHDMDTTHTLRITNNKDQIIEDLYIIIQIASSSKDYIKSIDLSKIYEIKTNVFEKIEGKNITQMYELLINSINSNQNVILEKLKRSKNMIKSQSKQIHDLQDQNKTLTNDLNKVKAALEAVNDTLKSKPSFSLPPPFQLPSSNNYARATAANVTQSSNNQTTPSSRQKRPTTNDDTSVSKKSATNHQNIATPGGNKTQKKVMNFNSFDPQSKNVPISSKNNTVFTIAGEKQQQKRQRNWQNKQYNRSVGLGTGSELLARKRKFFVYFGNIDINASTENVKDSLKSILNGIEFDDFMELNTDIEERKSKSFKFSIGYLDKDIINQKQLWPKYTIVNRYKMSLSEWEKVSANFKNKQNTTNSKLPANNASNPISIN